MEAWPAKGWKWQFWDEKDIIRQKQQETENFKNQVKITLKGAR